MARQVQKVAGNIFVASDQSEPSGFLKIFVAFYMYCLRLCLEKKNEKLEKTKRKTKHVEPGKIIFRFRPFACDKKKKLKTKQIGGKAISTDYATR